MNDVIVVGAGAAGLMAARVLARAGKSVTILEARERIGGRIFPLSAEEFGYEAMGGAEFVHGPAPVTMELLEEAGLRTENPTEWWSVRDGEPEPTHGPLVRNPALEAKLKALSEDMTVAQFLDRYFPAPDFNELRNFMLHWVEEYDAADPTISSVFSVRDEMLISEEWLQRNVKEGYGALIRHVAEDARAHGAVLRFAEEVTHIDFSGAPVSIRTKQATYQANAVIVTVPLPLISRIAYEPPVPKKLQAAEGIGFGSVVKILLRFRNKWWVGAREKQFDKLFFMFSNEEIPTWWTQYPEPYTTLTGWAAGPRARRLRTLSEVELEESALRSLSNIFGVDIDTLKKDLVCWKAVDWDNDPFALGAYSYPLPGSQAAIRILQEPESNKLYFAGEALALGEGQATVEGALASGLHAAKQLLVNSSTK